MANLIQLENIEQLRQRAGIEDIELRKEIRELGVGKFVKLTLLTSPTTSESLLVRITSIRGDNFRGKLVNSPAAAGLSKLRDGSPIVFATDHIHSLPKVQLAHHR